MADTIAAIATAAGNGGIGIIRISGNNSIKYVDSIFKCKNISLLNVDSHTINYGHIYDNDVMIDEVLVSVFRAPRSFTAEDVVEINCHGGSFVVRKILNLLFKIGVRPAEPGEFTKRAFLNGRIDLSQAEAVIDLINSKNDFALKNSLSQLNGSVHKSIIEMRELIIHETAFIEAALDDPEHYDIDKHREELCGNVNKIKAGINSILNNCDNGRLLKDGINTLIIGKPNVGKSSLLNILSGRDRAIVTDIAGTTRDSIEETIYLNGLTLNLIDTAGIRDTADTVEKIGVDRAIAMIDKADLILFIVDGSDVFDEDDEKIASILPKSKSILVFNKSDKITDDIINNTVEAFDSIKISALSGQGIDELSDMILKRFVSGEINFDEDIYLTNTRQRNEIEKAYKSINLVYDGIMMDMTEDLLAIDLMDTYAALGAVIGEEVADDLVDRVFSEFCMGK